MNLVPNHEKNTAHCQKCEEIFKGIPAQGCDTIATQAEKESAVFVPEILIQRVK